MSPSQTKANGSRRDFIKTGAVAGAAVLAQTQSTSAQPAMPQAQFGKYKISRLLMGSNPMLGYSHMTNLVSDMMQEYYTIENMVKALRHCTEQGINTLQSSYNPKMSEALQKFRAEGGEMQWVCLASNELIGKPDEIKAMMELHKPIAVAHHGWITDRLYRDGQLNQAKHFIKTIRSYGVMAGMSTHNPEILQYMHDEQWDVDFYMASCHYISRSDEELIAKLGQLPIPKREVYLEGDPPAMLDVVKKVDKPVLVYKILAAGRFCNRAEDVENRFQFAFEHIKKNDAVIVGMFQKFHDQVVQNAEFTRKYA